ncbi:hypothetical protein QBC47DRAFT_416343 [Echria macrotheca]|uniref:Uncharacterized protein n=1 Tax=Echria macrotheca TaxID=438768 RepID=A0AAJ0B6R0_9PEZI|nr:hypothetical protein QBC47DRAFT_416343 [Echria macrotheca]
MSTPPFLMSNFIPRSRLQYGLATSRPSRSPTTPSTKDVSQDMSCVFAADRRFCGITRRRPGMLSLGRGGLLIPISAEFSIFLASRLKGGLPFAETGKALEETSPTSNALSESDTEKNIVERSLDPAETNRAPCVDTKAIVDAQDCHSEFQSKLSLRGGSGEVEQEELQDHEADREDAKQALHSRRLSTSSTLSGDTLLADNDIPGSVSRATEDNTCAIEDDEPDESPAEDTSPPTVPFDPGISSSVPEPGDAVTSGSADDGPVSSQIDPSDSVTAQQPLTSFIGTDNSPNDSDINGNVSNHPFKVSLDLGEDERSVWTEQVDNEEASHQPCEGGSQLPASHGPSTICHNERGAGFDSDALQQGQGVQSGHQSQDHIDLLSGTGAWAENEQVWEESLQDSIPSTTAQDTWSDVESILVPLSDNDEDNDDFSHPSTPTGISSSLRVPPNPADPFFPPYPCEPQVYEPQEQEQGLQEQGAQEYNYQQHEYDHAAYSHPQTQQCDSGEHGLQYNNPLPYPNDQEIDDRDSYYDPSPPAPHPSWSLHSFTDAAGHMDTYTNAQQRDPAWREYYSRALPRCSWVLFPRREMVRRQQGVPELRVTTAEGEEAWPDDLGYYAGAESWADLDEDEDW